MNRSIRAPSTTNSRGVTPSEPYGATLSEACRSTRRRSGAFCTLLAALLISDCAGGATGGSSRTMLPPENRRAGSGKISHVVIVIQENRSFDDLFQGYPGADTQSYGYTSDGTKVSLAPIGLEAPWDIEHDSQGFFASCNGTGKLPGTHCRMNGFDKESVTCGRPIGGPRCPNADPQYGYVPAAETKPYVAMAQQYVLADRMFTSNFDASSFVSHQYAIAAQAERSVDFPSTNVWGCDGGPTDTVRTLTKRRAYGHPIQACFDGTTLADELDGAGVSWRYYTSKIETGDAGNWSAYQAIRHIRYGPDWTTAIVTPQTRFFKDVSNKKLPSVAWITPTCGNSDHAACNSSHGPQWVASIVNAIGKSPYWDSTVVFVFWDDGGGWYDHVPPPMMDYDGLGARVPLLVISAYAKQGYVSHVRYEHGSLLKFVEDQFGLARMAASDARANSPQSDCFDFSKPPRSFVAIPSTLHAGDFEREPLDSRPPDNE